MQISRPTIDGKNGVYDKMWLWICCTVLSHLKIGIVKLCAKNRKIIINTFVDYVQFFANNVQSMHPICLVICYSVGT